MKKTIFTGFAVATLIIAAAACQKAEFEGGNAPGGSSENLVPMTITASLEAGTKAALQEGGKVFWESGDAMTVMAVDAEGTMSASYEFTTTGEGEKAEFTGLVGEETLELSAGMYAVYPPTTGEYHPYIQGISGYSSVKHTVSSNVLTMFLPSTQFASTDALGLYSLCAGKAEIDEENNVGLTMKNVGGLIAITLPEQNITSVTLYGNENEQLAGVVTATFDDEGIPMVSSVAGSNMIRIVPSASGTTFAPGTYYINVPPMTFESGLTLVFTNNDSQYATLKSTAAFVVERSKVSPFPALPTLNFGGKYVDLTFANDYNQKTSVPFKYDSDNGNGYATSLPSTGYTVKGELVVSNGTYQLKLNASSWIRANSGWRGGLCLCGSAGTYVAFPSIEDFVLNKVSVRSGNMNQVSTSAGQCMTTTPDSEGSYEILPGCSAVTVPVYGGMDNIWSFSGDSHTGEFPFALTATSATNSNSGLRFQAFRLYYADASSTEVPSVNPLVTSVESSPIVDYTNKKVTFKGSFSAVDYSSLSQFTCGVDYKLATEADWTEAVAGTATSLEFSLPEMSFSSRSEYAYRPWVRFVKKDGQTKTVYGNEGVIDLSKIVLSLVFDDSYWDRTPEDKNANFLVREWGWKTNQNNSSLQDEELGEMNGKSYDFVYNGCAYPFTFYSLQGTYYDKVDEETGETESVLSPGGYTLRVASESQKTYGLCMNYINPARNLEAYPAWIQLPGVQNFKLKEVGANTYSENGFSIATDVVTDEDASETEKGTAKDGCVIGESVSKWAHSILLENANPGQRYYLCTVQSRITFKNMTLTYEYAGE